MKTFLLGNYHYLIYSLEENKEDEKLRIFIEKMGEVLKQYFENSFTWLLSSKIQIFPKFYNCFIFVHQHDQIVSIAAREK